MSLAARITRQPIAFDPAAAADVRAALPGLAAEVRELCAATAGCSPYLRGLMQREADWLREALSRTPEAALEAVLAAAGRGGRRTRLPLALAAGQAAGGAAGGAVRSGRGLAAGGGDGRLDRGWPTGRCIWR